MHSLIFLSKIWAKMCELYMAKSLAFLMDGAGISAQDRFPERSPHLCLFVTEWVPSPALRLHSVGWCAGDKGNGSTALVSRSSRELTGRARMRQRAVPW